MQTLFDLSKSAVASLKLLWLRDTNPPFLKVNNVLHLHSVPKVVSQLLGLMAEPLLFGIILSSSEEYIKCSKIVVHFFLMIVHFLHFLVTSCAWITCSLCNFCLTFQNMLNLIRLYCFSRLITDISTVIVYHMVFSSLVN